MEHNRKNFMNWTSGTLKIFIYQKSHLRNKNCQTGRKYLQLLLQDLYPKFYKELLQQNDK